MVQAAFQDAPETLKEEPGYRPLSGLAVAGFLVGLGSVAAFFGSALWSVPVLGAVLNLAAIYHIHSTQPQRAGGRLARIGLALSLFCLAGVLGYEACYEWGLQRQGARVIERYTNALREGRWPVAHQLSLPPAERDVRSEQLDEVYKKDALLADQLDEFKSRDAISRLANLDERELVLHRASPAMRARLDEGIIYVFRARGKKKPLRDNTDPARGPADATWDTFYVQIDIFRRNDHAHSIAGWQVRHPRIVQPDELP